MLLLNQFAFFSKQVRISIFSMLVLQVSSYSVAETLDKFGCGQSPVSVAFFEYGLIYSNGVGIDHDLMEELGRRTGCVFNFSVKPRARIWAELENGELAIGTYGLQTAERDNFCWFVPYISSKFYLVINHRNLIKVRGLSDFLENKNLKLGIVRSFKHGVRQDDLVDRLSKLNRIDESSDVNRQFLKFSAGRFDALLAEPFTFKKYLHNVNYDEVEVQDWAPSQNAVPHGLILSKKIFTLENVIQWQNVILKMRTDGTLASIFRKYLTEKEVREAMNFPLTPLYVKNFGKP